MKKRRLLEEKLEQRKERALRRQNKSQKSTKSVLKSEAAKDNVHKNKNYLSENTEESQSHSQESLEWDHSNETPSFVTNSWESDQLEEALKNLYRRAFAIFPGPLDSHLKNRKTSL